MKKLLFLLLSMYVLNSYSQECSLNKEDNNKLINITNQVIKNPDDKAYMPSGDTLLPGYYEKSFGNNFIAFYDEDLSGDLSKGDYLRITVNGDLDSAPIFTMSSSGFEIGPSTNSFSEMMRKLETIKQMYRLMLKDTYCQMSKTAENIELLNIDSTNFHVNLEYLTQDK